MQRSEEVSRQNLLNRVSPDRGIPIRRYLWQWSLNRLRDQNGSALMAAFWMLVVLLIAGLAASYTTTTEVGLSGNERIQAELFYLAEAGVAQTKKYLDGLGVQFDGTGTNRMAPRQVFPATEIGTPGGLIGRFTSFVDPKNNAGGKPTKYLAITVRAWIPGNTMVKVVQERVGQENFAKYAYFTDQETTPGGTVVWFNTGDVLRGPVHSNSQFNISGDPVFLKEVTTTASSVNYSGPSNPDFREGIIFDVDRIELPTDTSLIRVKSLEADGLYFGSTADLVLDYDPATEFASVSVDLGGGPTIYQVPANGVLYVNGDCTLKGVLRGQLTIACSGDMYIIDDILYTTDPRVDPQSTDILGLVADGDVFVADTPENLDTGDETIMAVIMALGTSFTAENYSAGTTRGYLRVIGGILQLNRGPVGTFDMGGGLISGYEKDYVYDARLADSPPPAFPTTGRIMTLAWKEMNPSYDISSDVF